MVDWVPCLLSIPPPSSALIRTSPRSHWMHMAADMRVKHCYDFVAGPWILLRNGLPNLASIPSPMQSTREAFRARSNKMSRRIW
jgi:hypothetical protein